MNKNNWQLGITKVFLRDYQYQELEDMRNKAIEKKGNHYSKLVANGSCKIVVYRGS